MSTCLSAHEAQAHGVILHLQGLAAVLYQKAQAQKPERMTAMLASLEQLHTTYILLLESPYLLINTYGPASRGSRASLRLPLPLPPLLNTVTIKFAMRCSAHCPLFSAGMQSTMVPAVSSNHRSPRRRDAGMSPGQGSRRRRPKQAQPILVIMPDGYSLCFAVKENPVGGAAASSSHAIPGIANPVVPDRPAAVSPLMGDSQLQPDSNAAISLTRMHVSAPSAESGLPGSSAAATS